MTTQLQLLPQSSVLSALSAVKSEREQILAELSRQSGSDFIEKAKAFVLRYLAEHGATSGERITDACRESGIRPSGSDKAFGCVYLSLSRAGKIEKAGTCERRKGHGTAGGIIWRISDFGERIPERET